ncbi:hypothetical protein Holit_02901 [Hollandina sp. SP2]
MDYFIVPKKYHNCEQGEDIIVLPYCSRNSGFYVDIGAFHPKRYSVTRIFYERGWRGINIEPNPHAIKVFDRIRKRDINLNLGVADETGELNYYFWGKDDTSNTFDSEYYEAWSKQRGHGAKEIIKIKVDTLNNIFKKHLPESTSIDFLTIDVEGYEFRILRSLDYDKYAPKLILVEDLGFYNKNKDFMDFKETEMYKFMNGKGYIVVGKTWYTILFKKKE